MMERKKRRRAGLDQNLRNLRIRRRTRTVNQSLKHQLQLKNQSKKKKLLKKKKRADSDLKIR